MIRVVIGRASPEVVAQKFGGIIICFPENGMTAPEQQEWASRTPEEFDELTIITISAGILSGIQSRFRKEDISRENIYLWNSQTHSVDSLWKHISRDWAAHFSLADLYTRGELVERETNAESSGI